MTILRSRATSLFKFEWGRQSKNRSATVALTWYACFCLGVSAELASCAKANEEMKVSERMNWRKIRIMSDGPHKREQTVRSAAVLRRKAT